MWLDHLLLSLIQFIELGKLFQFGNSILKSTFTSKVIT